MRRRAGRNSRGTNWGDKGETSEARQRYPLSTAADQPAGLLSIRASILKHFRPQPSFLIGDLFANYWTGRDQPIPSTAIVTLLADFGITSSGSRTALSRLARQGKILRTTGGRQTFYAQTPAGAAQLRQVHELIGSFGAGRQTWDGQWWLVAFHVPEAWRERRSALRLQLRSLGFGPLFDGLWIAPRGTAEVIRNALETAQVQQATVFRARIVVGHEVQAAWDFGQLERRYRMFLAIFEPALHAARTGLVPPADALLARTAARYWWRRFAADDPDLPPEFLPEGWPQADARRLFAALERELGPLAQRRVDETAHSGQPKDRGNLCVTCA